MSVKSWQEKLRERLAARKQAHDAYRKAAAAVKAARVKLAAAKARKAASKSVWMPGAVRDPQENAGPFVLAKPKGVLHTTEGNDFDAMDQVLKTKRACPHFLVGQQGQIKQYAPINLATRALEHVGFVETNRAHAIQIEVCGFASKTDWPLAQVAAVRQVIGYCRAHGVPATSSVTFTDSAHVRRLSPQDWLAYSGWLGHQHVPDQPSGHWDPGAIDVQTLLRGA